MNIKEHPIHEQIYNLCREIEKLPASGQATKLAVMASELHPPVKELHSALNRWQKVATDDLKANIKTRQEVSKTATPRTDAHISDKETFCFDASDLEPAMALVKWARKLEVESRQWFDMADRLTDFLPGGHPPDCKCQKCAAFSEFKALKENMIQ